MTQHEELTQPINPAEAIAEQAKAMGAEILDGFPESLEALRSQLDIDLDVKPTDGGVFISGGDSKVGLGIQQWKNDSMRTRLGPRQGVSEPVVAGLSLDSVKDFIKTIEKSDPNRPAEVLFIKKTPTGPSDGSAEERKTNYAKVDEVNSSEDLTKMGANIGDVVLFAHASPYSNSSATLRLRIEDQESSADATNPTFALEYLDMGAPTHSGRVEESLKALTTLLSSESAK